MRVYVDHTHLGRPVTGLERITLQLFSVDALAPLDVVPIRARGTAGMMLKQQIGLAAHLAHAPSSMILCPGFPPGPLLQIFGARVLPYIHDVFLLSRRNDLNWRAKAYMAWPFARTVHRLPRFLTNSNDTARKLREHCRDDATITLYRPAVQNNFALAAGDRAARPVKQGVLRLVALGTVEPRKNLVAAGRIVQALRAAGFADTSLDIIGRRGWGDDWSTLSVMPGVTLHGYQPEAGARAILDGADALICTSHEEGLGLPLLEVQYAGLPVIAPDQPVFREVLDGSGLFINPADPRAAAAVIAGALTGATWRAEYVARAAINVHRWNELAAADHGRVIELLLRLGRRDQAQAELLRPGNERV